jgi:hypothetical protein
MASLQALGGISKLKQDALTLEFYDDHRADEWDALGVELTRVPGGVSLDLREILSSGAHDHCAAMAGALMRPCAASVRELWLWSGLETLLG